MIIVLTDSRRKRISEVLGNISVGWFAAGIIAPIFLRNKIISEFFISFLFGFFPFLLFLYLSLKYESEI